MFIDMCREVCANVCVYLHEYMHVFVHLYMFIYMCVSENMIYVYVCMYQYQKKLTNRIISLINYIFV